MNAYGHPMLRTLNDLINFSIITECNKDTVLYDVASKYHRWSHYVEDHLAGMIGVRSKLFEYDITYLKNHQPSKKMQITHIPVDSSTPVPKYYQRQTLKPEKIVAVLNDCVYYTGVAEHAHNLALGGVHTVVVNFLAMPDVDGVYTAFDDECTVTINGGIAM